MMLRSDLNTVVPKTTIKVNISHTPKASLLSLNTPIFSEIDRNYSDKNPNSYGGVYNYHTLNSLAERLNTFDSQGTKDNNPAILKGIYKGGTKGEYCTTGAPYLFFDIDVKNKENVHLNDAKLNSDVFTALQDIAVLCWRSFSKKGIAGILYVPQLENFLVTKKDLHLSVGKNITEYLTNVLRVNASFDNAQSRFRQIRYLATQDTKRKINPTPYKFTFELTEEIIYSKTGTKQYRFNSNKDAYGTIQQQFNNNNPIDNSLLSCGFSYLGSNRYKHPYTTSQSTGVVFDNIFYNHSSSFSEYKVFTPFWLHYNCGSYNNVSEFIKHLKKQGYEEIEPTKNIVKLSQATLSENKQDRQAQIFEACYDLINLSYAKKVEFAKANAKNEKELIWFYDYLKIKPLSIKYDSTININKYVGEQIETVLTYADQHKQVIATAETGTGKTTAFLRNFTQCRPNKRLLILVPLTVIADQIKAEYDIVKLTGESEPKDHTKAKKASMVVATYEQGTKHLQDKHTFDYVVIDEVHNIITANSYKSKQIEQLTKCLNNTVIIGLTGTANLLFKAIGYKLLNITKREQTSVPVNMRIDNRDSFKVIIQHLQQVTGKVIFRLNNVKALLDAKKYIAKETRYSESEILILNSDRHIKNSKDFKKLSSESMFNNNIKIVLTTGLIDEGLSIKQKGFTDVVFIENQFHPTPEALKQFFARFRNEDLNRKNYYYFRETKNQKLISYNPFIDYQNRYTDLIEDIKDHYISTDSGNDSANNDNLYYNNGVINKYALANQVSLTFFKLLTTYEFIRFLETNYNLKINLDSSYTVSKIEDKEKKENATAEKIQLSNLWHTDIEAFEHAVYNLTTKSDIKSLIPYIGYPVTDSALNLVYNNLKVCEKLTENHYKLIQLGKKETASVLFSDEKPTSTQIVNREIKLLENLKTINNPTTKTDQKNKVKLLNFVDEVGKLESFTANTLVKIWKQKRVSSLNINSYNLIDLVLHYKPYSYNRKTRYYTVTK